MAYFEELPDILSVSLLPSSNKIENRIVVKNIFKRSKLRGDVEQAITAFNYYYIEQGMRPDMVAKSLYDDPELDWVVLTSNNITNVRDQWPLEDNDLHQYMLEKYGSEQNILGIHHHETNQVLDEFGRVVVPKGLVVDAPNTYDRGIFLTYRNYSNAEVEVNVSSAIKVVTNYDYENKINDEKRRIRILRPEYLSVFLTDHRNIMRYDRSSNYISAKLKGTENPRISGV